MRGLVLAHVVAAAAALCPSTPWHAKVRAPRIHAAAAGDDDDDLAGALSSLNYFKSKVKYLKGCTEAVLVDGAFLHAGRLQQPGSQVSLRLI